MKDDIFWADYLVQIKEDDKRSILTLSPMGSGYPLFAMGGIIVPKMATNVVLDQNMVQVC